MFVIHIGVLQATSMDSGKGEKRKCEDYDDETLNPSKRICVVDRWTETTVVHDLTELFGQMSLRHRIKCSFQTGGTCPHSCPTDCPCPFQCPMDCTSDPTVSECSGTDYGYSQDLAENTDLTDFGCSEMDLGYCQIQTENTDLADFGCSDMDMGYPQIQTENTDLADFGCSGMVFGYPQVQTENTELAAYGSSEMVFGYPQVQAENTDLAAYGGSGMVFGYPQVQAENTDLAAFGCSGMVFGYPQVQTENTDQAASGCFGTDFGGNMYMCKDGEPPLTTPDQVVDVRYTPLSTINPTEEEEPEDDKELTEEEIEYFLELINERHDRTVAARNLELNEEDDETDSEE